MTKGEALYRFFSQFGMDAYPSDVIPDAKKVKFPYLTYDAPLGNTGDSISSTVFLWFRTESATIPEAKVEEVARAIGMGGTVIRYDDGAIWIKRGSPWCNALVDDTDATLKRRILNIELEFI